MTKAELLQVLSRHIGEVSGVSAEQLCVAVCGEHTPFIERRMRHLVTELRLEGYHVCAHPSSGYFMASTGEELDRCCAFLYDRAMASLQQIAAMKRVSLPDLRGQLRLPT